MKMWIVLCQAITFAILLEQYQCFNEVEAEEHHTLSAGGWVGDLEQTINVIKSVSSQTQETKEPQQNHKKKKKVKRNKKKLKPKRKVKPKKLHVVKKNIEKARTEKAHKIRLRVDKAHANKALEENLAEDKPKPKSRVTKIKLRRKKASKFVKTKVDSKFNDSESNESIRKGKPVDIIVHIKMNE